MPELTASEQSSARQAEATFSTLLQSISAQRRNSSTSPRPHPAKPHHPTSGDPGPPVFSPPQATDKTEIMRQLKLPETRDQVELLMKLTQEHPRIFEDAFAGALAHIPTSEERRGHLISLQRQDGLAPFIRRKLSLLADSRALGSEDRSALFQEKQGGIGKSVLCGAYGGLMGAQAATGNLVGLASALVSAIKDTCFEEFLPQDDPNATPPPPPEPSDGGVSGGVPGEGG